MILGYILGGEHELFQSVSNVPSEVDMPLIVYGYELACHLFGDNVYYDKNKIGYNIWYCFNDEESSVSDIDGVIYHIWSEVTEGITVDFVTNFDNIKLSDSAVFKWENEYAYIYAQFDNIYYLNKELLHFFNGEEENIKDIDERFPVIQFGDLYYFESVLYSNEIFENENTLLYKFKNMPNYSIYFPYICLNYYINNKESRGEKTWHRAFFIEDYLSHINIPVNISSDSKLFELAEKSMVDKNHIRQRVKGTDKVTGRMYPYNSFSLQNLSDKNKDIVVPEENCTLTEYDYDYFEYSLLYQICGYGIPKDPHLFLAKEVFEDEGYRDFAKKINYSFLYGKRLKKIISDLKKTYNINVEHTKEILYDIMNPAIDFRDKLEKEWGENYKLYNYFDKVIYPDKQYKALNNYIQSTAADFLISKMVKLVEVFLEYSNKNKILFQNHDSIILNLYNFDVQSTKIIFEIEDILASNERGIRCNYEVKIGKDWKNLDIF